MRNAGSVRFKDAPGGKGTEVHVYLEYQPVGGPAGAAAAKLMKQVTLQQIRMDMGRFKAILEADEAPTTEGQTSGREKLKPGDQGVQRAAGAPQGHGRHASDAVLPGQRSRRRWMATQSAGRPGRAARMKALCWWAPGVVKVETVPDPQIINPDGCDRRSDGRRSVRV